MEDRQSTKFDLLLQLNELMLKIPGMLFTLDSEKNAGHLSEAISIAEDLVSNLRSILDLHCKNNALFPDSPFESSSTVNIIINTLLTQADLYEAIGTPDKADSIRNEAMSISRENLPEKDIPDRERQLVDSLIGQGRFNEALSTLSNVKDELLAKKDVLKYSMASVKYAGILEWLGDYSRSLRVLDEIEEIIKPIAAKGNANMESMASAFISGNFDNAETVSRIVQILFEIEMTRARLNRFEGNFDEAELQFRQLLKKTPDPAKPAVEYQLSAIAIEEGKYEKGLDMIRSLKPSFTGLLRMKYGVLLSLESEALFNLGYLSEALSTIDEAIDALNKYNDKDSLWKAYWRRARVLSSLDRNQDSLQSIRKSAEVISNLRRAPLGYRLDSLYLKDKIPVFEEGIRLACEMGSVEDCIILMEMIKARILAASLSVPRIEASGDPNQLDVQFDEISRKLDQLEYMAFDDNIWTDEIEAERQRYMHIRAELIERIRFSDPRWRTLSEPVEFKVTECLDYLHERELPALSLFMFGNHITTVFIHDGVMQAKVMLISKQTQQCLSRYIENLSSPSPNPKLYDPSSELGLDASDLIPSSFLEEIVKYSDLVISPHGLLHLLPWAGMQFRGKRLLESTSVSIVPNLSCIIPLCSGTISEKPSIGLIGNPNYPASFMLEPLNNIEAEMKSIAKAYSLDIKEYSLFFTGDDATEANFWELVTSENLEEGIAHISCHGDFVIGDPMNSGLLMSDGKVDAAEIAKSNLTIEEVVLSSCSSGCRSVKIDDLELTGDDILGLPGAFIEAGVSSLLVSIPKAREDTARRFMTLYHRNRASGNAPRQAFRSAQIHMMESGVFPSYLWIGFTLYGCR